MLYLPGIKKRKCSGFTLVEVCVAMLAMTVIIIIFGGSVLLAQRAGNVNGQYAQALSICQHKIDQLRAVGYYRAMSYDELYDAGIIDETPNTSPFSFDNADNVDNYLPNASGTIKIKESTSKYVIVEVAINWRNSVPDARTSNVRPTAQICNVD